jgi:hypothetical protein
VTSLALIPLLASALNLKLQSVSKADLLDTIFTV